jgi:hypothetical protein
MNVGACRGGPGVVPSEDVDWTVIRDAIVAVGVVAIVTDAQTELLVHDMIDGERCALR